MKNFRLLVALLGLSSIYAAQSAERSTLLSACTAKISQAFCCGRDKNRDKTNVPDEVRAKLDAHAPEVRLIAKRFSKDKYACGGKNVSTRRWLPGCYIKYGHERYYNAQYLANFIRERNLNLLGVAEKWLYHVPGRPYTLTSNNYVTIAKQVVPSNDFDPIDEHWTQLGQLPHYDIQTSNFVLADGKIVIIDTDIHAMPTKPNGDYYPPSWERSYVDLKLNERKRYLV